MKIETKLTLNNIRKNKKRAVFTAISIILCVFLIFTVMLIISSIMNGIDKSLGNDDNVYYFNVNNLSVDDFNKIKDKYYIETIYLQNNESELYELKDQNIIFSEGVNNINVYLKFIDINKVCSYCNDIIATLNFMYDDVIENCEINEELLSIHGVKNISIVSLTGVDVIITSGANLSYLIDVLVLLVLIVFSVLFVIILYNSFLITINERRREYAILNSIGATKNQIKLMIFKEATIIGIIGIIIGGLLSVVGTEIILKIINNILADTIYNFELSIKPLYLVLLIIVVIINIFISAIIPSIEASNTSVIQGIKNNKHIKSKKRRGILERVLPVEGKIAVKNLKRNKSKYRIIILLLVICMTSYIVVETYIKYEEKTADLIDYYDVDAEICFYSELDIDYETILENYVKKTGDNVEYVEYEEHYVEVISEPSEAVLYDFGTMEFGDEIIEYQGINLIVLDNETYNNYLSDLGEENADYIVYNNIVKIPSILSSSTTYKFYKVFDENYDLNLKIIDIYEADRYIDIRTGEYIVEYEYKIMDDESLTGKVVYTDEYLDFFKDTSINNVLNIFINKDKYTQIEENVQNYFNSNEITSFSVYGVQYLNNYNKYIKVRCGNIISFSNYMNNIIEEQGLDMYVTYYTLENQENIIYVNILGFLLKLIIGTVAIIGIASSVNILNASLNERKSEFETLNSIGATNKNINKILIYECIIIFIKALIISLIISIPIIYKIIEYMKNIIVLEETLIPYINIVIFILVLFIVSLVVTLNSGKTVKNKVEIL